MSTYHQINAYEEDGFLIMDICASDHGQAIENYVIQNLRKSGEALDEVRDEEKVEAGDKIHTGLIYLYIEHVFIFTHRCTTA